jgi:NADH:ubiquinone oxidoreductase subunit K
MHDHTIEAVRNQYLVVAIVLLTVGVLGLFKMRKNKTTISAELSAISLLVATFFHLYLHTNVIPF